LTAPVSSANGPTYDSSTVFHRCRSPETTAVDAGSPTRTTTSSDASAPSSSVAVSRNTKNASLSPVTAVRSDAGSAIVAAGPAPSAFPASRLSPGSLDFSFSGLKTAVLYAIRGVPEPGPDGPRFPREFDDLADDDRAAIAASFQTAACRAVVVKVRRAAQAAPTPYRSLLVGGGVSANRRLRAELTSLAADEDLEIRLPKMRYCLDNAAMLAGLAYHRLAAGDVDDLALQAAPSSALAPHA